MSHTYKCNKVSSHKDHAVSPSDTCCVHFYRDIGTIVAQLIFIYKLRTQHQALTLASILLTFFLH